MKKSKNVVDPWEFRAFVETLGHNHNYACRITSWIAPECEVHTRDFNMEEELEELAEATQDGDKFDIHVRQAVIAFMNHHAVTTFTMTQ